MSSSPRFHSSYPLSANDRILHPPPMSTIQRGTWRLTESTIPSSHSHGVHAAKESACCSNSTIAFVRRALVFTVCMIVIAATFFTIHKEMTLGRILFCFLFLTILAIVLSPKARTKYARTFELVIEITVVVGVPACILTMRSVQSSTFVAMCLVRGAAARRQT